MHLLPVLVAPLSLASALMVACGGGDAAPLPATWTLDAAGIRVVVTRDPYRYEVRDVDGVTVLESFGDGAADGSGTVGFARGETTWDTIISPGWFRFGANLEPWRDAWHVVAATQPGPGELVLELAPRGAGARDVPADRVRVVHRVRPSTLRIEATLTGADPAADAPAPARAFAATFRSPPGEAFLGFGERFNRADQRGVDVYGWAEEGGIGPREDAPRDPRALYPNGEAMSYYPVPFFVSTAGHGFWLDSTWRHEFNLATLRPDAWRVWHIGPDLAFEVYVRRPGDARAWPYHVIDAFTETTGRPATPPAWAFGPRRRIGAGSMRGDVHEIQAMRDLDLALTAVDDAVHFLPDGSHVGREEELRAWTARARALGCRVNGYYNPYVADRDDGPLRAVRDEGLQRGYFLHDGEGRPSTVFLVSGSPLRVLTVDFTREAAVDWYTRMFDWAIGLGYSGFMYDFGEYVAPDVVASDGTSGEALHNLFPVLYQRAGHVALERSPIAGDWLFFARSGYTGASAWAPFVWSGDPAASFEDLDGLPSMVRAGLSLGISGVPHSGGDIGGFHCVSDGAGAADDELLTRWVQQGALTPNMQDQNACAGEPGGRRKLALLDAPGAVGAWREYARLHTRLQPYFHALSREAARTGAPLIRHVFLEHPDRADLASVDDAYYLGPALYVVPVVRRGARQRTVTLPAGHYLDWRDQRLIAGGDTVTLDAPLEKLPLLLRAGHLVPLLDPRIDTLVEEQSLEIVGPTDVADVYDVVGLLDARAAGAASFTLHDGRMLRARWTGAFAAPADLAQAASDEELATCGACWLRTEGQGHVRVRISAADGTVAAGGLSLESAAGRRVRWDLYLVE